MGSEQVRPFGSSGLGPGTVLDGKYEILNRLGAGGMGEVFKARHVHLNTFRCIKVMKQSLLTDDVFRMRFLREARLATQIHHPNIAVVHDFFLGEGGSYMVTEFIDGTTVRQWGAQHGRFPLALAADVATQVLAGLDHIHRRGLLHRDISPDNVMLSFDADDRLIVKIIDLGIAKDLANNVASDTTQVGMLVGNPKYMSPEQLGSLPDGEQMDGRADLYSLGVVLYEMLLGVPPFASETPQGYIIKHLTEPPRRFRDANPNVDWPEGMEAVIFRTLEKDRKKRFSDARDLSSALQKFLAAPAGSLTRTHVTKLSRSGPETTVRQMLPNAADMPTMAETPAETSLQRDWKKTQALDTIDAYTEYVTKHPDAPQTTDAKARLFELELLGDVDRREKGGDREGLQRLAEGHPPGTLVGDAVRGAIARLSKVRQLEQEQEEAFQNAWEIGSSAAWQEFLDKHPSSYQRNRAQQLLEEARAFESAVSRDSETGLRDFIKLWPDGRHHLEAEIRLVEVKEKLAEQAFAQASAADTYGAMRDYLARFPTSPRTEEAKKIAAERLAFETAASADTEESWDAYLTSWPNDAHAADARSRRDAVRGREEEAYKAAMEGKTAAAWEKFLAEHPHSRRNARADRNRREALAFEQVKGGGRAELQEFLRRHSDGLLAKDAQRLLRQVADAEDFEHAKSVDKPGSWQLYLQAHSSGAHAADARQRLTELEDAAFASVLTAKNAKAGAEFLSDFPDSPRRDELTRLVAKWNEAAAVQEALDAIAAGDVARAESLLGRISDGDRKSEVTDALEGARDQQSWEEAQRAETPGSLRAYLDARPNGRWASEARKRLSKLQTEMQAAEPADWERAWELGTVQAWDRYLEHHPDSPRAGEAKHWRQEADDFDLACLTNTPAMWRAFLKTWPEGRHRMDAEVRLRGGR